MFKRSELSSPILTNKVFDTAAATPMHRSREILTDKLIISDSINEFSGVTGIDKSIYDFSMSTNT